MNAIRMSEEKSDLFIVIKEVLDFDRIRIKARFKAGFQRKRVVSGELFQANVKREYSTMPSSLDTVKIGVIVKIPLIA
jgi:hypothetical protein